jgi:thiol-disulfide isomerase/thioredoxin
MWKPVSVIAVLLLSVAGSRLLAEDLSVGDAAPKIEVKEFIKGDPVTDWAKDKIYVVEFWATWCGPCRATIPHLTDLQKKNKDVRFIGVSVFEQDQKKGAPFVKEMGDKMDYAVALDKVPEDKKGSEGIMAKTWMEAAAQEGIPTAFVVNGEGKVAWIGHPMNLEKPLEKIVEGKWDLQLASAEYKKEQAAKKKMRAVFAKISQASRSDDPENLVKVLDEVFVDDPKLETQFGAMKYSALARQADAQDKALQYGCHLVEEVIKDDAEALNNFAWNIVEPKKDKKPEAKAAQLALSAAQRSDEIAKSKAPHIADTLALAYFTCGDVAKALETQERALSLAKGTPFEKDQSMKNRLEDYRQAAKK